MLSFKFTPKPFDYRAGGALQEKRLFTLIGFSCCIGNECSCLLCLYEASAVRRVTRGVCEEGGSGTAAGSFEV